MTQDSTRLKDLKRELGSHLLSSEQVTPPPGVASGWPKLDQFLLWHGFPKSSVSLMVSESGGATTLWIKSAAHITKQNKWAGWFDNSESSLTPWSLRHRGVDLSKFISVGAAKDERQLLWALQELMSLSLVELIGCDLGSWQLKEHQILKLKKLAVRYSTALVLITKQPPRRISSFFSLVLCFKHKQVTVTRALHRPTPFTLERRDLYADTLPQLAAGRRALCG